MARFGPLLAVCAIVVISVAAATSVTITKTTYAQVGGFFVRPYFENANAPITGCTSPCLTVDTQGTQPGTSGSFSLAAGSSMYLWTPQFSTATSIPAGALSLQLFADPPAPALDRLASGSWSSGNTFSISGFTATSSNEVVLLSIETYKSGTSITVSSVSDSLSGVAWQGSARSSSVSCSGTQETTHIEWYGIAATTLSSDAITITLSATPTSASGIAFGVTGADTTTPFDPTAGLPNKAVDCTGTSTVPTVTGVSTVGDTDFMFAFFGGYTSVIEKVGTIGAPKATLIWNVAGTGASNAAEYVQTTSAQSLISCSFGSSTSYWGVLCDALMPARQTITVSYVTTNSAGTVQSTMISGSSATLTASNQPVSLSSSSGTVPASGYVRVVITAPAGAALTVNWGSGKLTQFQVSYTYRSQ